MPLFSYLALCASSIHPSSSTRLFTSWRLTAVNPHVLLFREKPQRQQIVNHDSTRSSLTRNDADVTRLGALVTRETSRTSQKVRSPPTFASICSAADRQKPTSSQRSNSTRQATTWLPATREAALFFSNVMRRYPPSPPPTKGPQPLTQARKKHASTNSTPSSNHMSPSLTISNPSRLRKKSTRSNGAGDKTHRIICCRPTTRPLSYGRSLRSRSRSWPRTTCRKT